MATVLFESILKRAGNRENLSRDWFRNQAMKTSMSPNRLMKSDQARLHRIPMIGSMYLFNYDPKLKDVLPYYDTFPLVIPIDSTRTSGFAGRGGEGFYGLNLHYIPPLLRAKLMDGLYQYVTDDRLSAEARLRITYPMLRRTAQLKYFRPCIKQYLFSHVRTRFFYIEPSEWELAMFLNLARFQKASLDKVYSDSRGKIL